MTFSKQTILAWVRVEFGLRGRVAMVLGLLGSVMSIQSQQVIQQVTLRPGWNSIFLEVQPSNGEVSAVFAGIPVSSVWGRGERLSTVDFIQDQNEIAWNESDWLVHFPADRPEAVLSTLYSMDVNRPYLVQLKGNQNVSLTISGRPSLRYPQWVTDSFNLRGFPVDVVGAPTFRQFFQSSPAHYNESTGTLEEIYRLGSDGRWIQVSPTEGIVRGVGYWTFCRGASEFLAPLDLELDRGDGLDYGLVLNEMSLRLVNRGNAADTFRIMSNLGNQSALVYWNFNPQTGALGWLPLSQLSGLGVPVGESAILRLAVQRSSMSTARHSEVLEVTNSGGVWHRIPVSSERGAGGGGGGGGALGVQTASSDFSGLWVGSARVTAVSEANTGNNASPTPTRSGFDIRLLIHVDREGRSRLLKEVIQMWEDGTYRTVPGGGQVEDQAGRFVLLTDHALASRYKGVTVRDGASVGRRLSSVGIDFEGGADNTLLLSGNFRLGGSLNANLKIPASHPTNPFRHKFHPDHAQGHLVERSLSLDFAKEGETPFVSADLGYREMGGGYRETITGLHHRPIQVQGTFRLIRVAETTELNPQPRLN